MDRPWSWRLAVAGCAGVLVATACGGAQPGPAAGGAGPPVSTPSPTAQGSVADWQQIGATETPPGSLRQVTLGSTRVANETNGAVTDADARAWAAAFLRTYGYVQWAVRRAQQRFLVDGSLSAAPLSVFRPNLNDILAGQQANGHVEYSPQTFRRLVVRAAPQSLQQLYSSVQFVWTQYAIYLDAVGPASTTVVDAAGNRRVTASVAAGAPEFELVGGQLAHSPLMGDVWMIDADFDCLAPATRQGVAPLCNP